MGIRAAPAHVRIVHRWLAGIAGTDAFPGRSALPSRVPAIDDSQAETTTCKKKPSLRRVAPEGFRAASISCPRQTDVKVIEDFAGCGIN